MTKAEKEERVAFLKRETYSIKSRLMDICNEMEEVSKREAKKLGNIIGRLEDWEVR